MLKIKKEEAVFENNMIKYAPYAGCIYVKIPDVVGIIAKVARKQQEKEGASVYIAHNRPCDAIFICKYGNALIEAKYNINQLTPKQLEFGKQITAINYLFFVIRKKHLKNITQYSFADVYGENLFKTNNIIELIRAIRDKIREYTK